MSDTEIPGGASDADAAAAAADAADVQFSIDDAARSLLRAPKGHGPLQRLYRGETRFDFVGRRRVWFTASSAIIVAGIVSIILRGGLNLGIQFKGGTEWTIAAPGITQAQAVDQMKGTGLIDPTVELLGSGAKQTLTVQSDLNKLSQSAQTAITNRVEKQMVLLTASHHASSGAANTTTPPAAKSTTTTAATGSTTTSATTGSTTTSTSVAGKTTATTTATTTVPPTGSSSSAGSNATEKISITHVGPTWGSSVTNKAIEALIIFFIVVAAYISIRFEPKMALAAFIAMIHDVLVAVGIYSLFNFQVTPDTVVAILTILGYSLYDTVVVFDRVRDNTKGIGSTGRMTYTQLINLSMNQTLARSINTSLVAILPVLAVLLVGAQLLGATTLQDYGLALFVGLLSGAYSSIFIAAPVLAMLKRGESRWVAIEQRLGTRADRVDSFSATDAATMSTQIAIASGGQPRRGSGAAKRTGPIRPGSGTSAGTAVMNRPAAGGAGAGSTSGGNRPPARPRKGKGKRQR